MATRSDRNTLDLRVQRTYKLLKDAFVLLMSQMPYDQITVQLICEKAMVRRTTFYQHFEDKHNFLQWFVREKQQEFSELTRNSDPPIDMLSHYCLMARNLLKSLNRNEHVLHLLMDAGVQSQILIDAFSCACVEDVVQRIEESPLGRAVMGRRVGDRATVRVNDEVSYPIRILKIEKGQDDDSLPISSY